MSIFKDIPTNGFFITFDEPYMKTTMGDGWDGEPNAFNFLMGQPVELDPHWEVTSVTYQEIVKRFFGVILSRVCDG